jgi:hypothetical protein
MKYLIKSLMGAAIVSSTFISSKSLAQTSAQTAVPNDYEQINLIKLNAGALLLKTFSVQYERAISRKTSLALGFRATPKSGLPFKSTLESIIDDEETWRNVRNLETGSFAITPEFRYYLGKKQFSGFYFAPFVRYSRYTADMPFIYDITDPTTNTILAQDVMPLTGSMNTYTAGIMIGSQWQLSKKFYFDWWILGPNFGASKGKIDGTKNLSAFEQQDLREQLADLDIPLTDYTYEVIDRGARLDFDGGWAGVRAGLAVGFRF